MVRATATVVKRMFGDAYPPGWTATTVGYWCDYVDDELDEYELSTSSAGAINLANLLVYRRVEHAIWMSAGGPMTGQQEPKIWTEDLLELRRRLADEGTYEFVTVVDTVNDGDRT